MLVLMCCVFSLPCGDEEARLASPPLMFMDALALQRIVLSCSNGISNTARLSRVSVIVVSVIS